jgi:hypothetical protein
MQWMVWFQHVPIFGVLVVLIRFAALFVELQAMMADIEETVRGDPLFHPSLPLQRRTV